MNLDPNPKPAGHNPYKPRIAAKRQRTKINNVANNNKSRFPGVPTAELNNKGAIIDDHLVLHNAFLAAISLSQACNPDPEDLEQARRIIKELKFDCHKPH
jgi:hypothetical protein